MNRTVSRWYPVLPLRNAVGRFMALRVPVAPRKPRRRRSIVVVRVPATQLALSFSSQQGLRRSCPMPSSYKWRIVECEPQRLE